MVIREVVKEDLAALDAMFREHDTHSPSVSLCSGTGVVVEEHGVIVGCSFIYMTNSPISLMDLFCVRKSLTKDHRSEVIDALISASKDMAQSLGYKIIICSPIFKRSEKRLIEHGFEEKSDKVFWYEVE